MICKKLDTEPWNWVKGGGKATLAIKFEYT